MAFTLTSLLLTLVESAILVPEYPLNIMSQSSGFEGPLLQRNLNTTLVIFGTRHANRNPEVFFNDSQRDWGKEGPLELNEIGIRQSVGLGGALRAFAGPNSIDGPTLIRAESTEFYSSSANRCQQTMKIVSDQLFPDNSVDIRVDDPMLRMYSIESCAKSDSVWSPITNDSLPTLQSVMKENWEILCYMRDSLGWKISLSDAANVADNLHQIELFGASYPEWIEHPTIFGFTKETLIARFLSFMENHQIACAEYEPCRDMMAGVWIAHIVAVLDGTADDQSPSLVGYSSHTEITLSTMKILGMEEKSLETAAGFLIEYRPDPSSVRILSHQPLLTDGHTFQEPVLNPLLNSLKDADGFIPLETFKNFISNFAILNWQSACGLAPGA